MNQNLSSYRIFYTVANTGNISKAAKELYISQPAISKSIQKLEESVGCKLFSRSSRGVVLTEEGKLLYEHVSSAFETLNLGEEKLRRSIELGVGHLKIGVSATLCKYMLLPYLKEFIRRNPHISISITCQSTNETLRLIEDNKIDIGLIGKPDSIKNIQFDFLEEIEDVFVATKDYIRNLRARGIQKNQILSSSTLMLLDKNNMTQPIHRRLSFRTTRFSCQGLHRHLQHGSSDRLRPYRCRRCLRHQKFRVRGPRLRRTWWRSRLASRSTSVRSGLPTAAAIKTFQITWENLSRFYKDF